jgi:hypothetical protein
MDVEEVVAEVRKLYADFPEVDVMVELGYDEKYERGPIEEPSMRVRNRRIVIFGHGPGTMTKFALTRPVPLDRVIAETFEASVREMGRCVEAAQEELLRNIAERFAEALDIPEDEVCRRMQLRFGGELGVRTVLFDGEPYCRIVSECTNNGAPLRAIWTVRAEPVPL